MKKLLIILLLCLLAADAGAAEKIRPEVFRMVTDSIARMYSRKTTVQNRLTLKKVERTGDVLELHFDHSLSDFPWREKDVEWFRTQFKKLMPAEYASCEIGKVFAKDTELEDLVTPPLGLKGWPQPYDHATGDRNLHRLFVEREGSVHYPKGMSGRNIALWQSHGRYFDEGSGQWKWQRAPLHRTVEDMYTQSYVIPFLIPMLERAGAYILTPRERDIQKYEVIVDNDPSFTGERVLPMRQTGIYNETGEWEGSLPRWHDAPHLLLAGADGHCRLVLPCPATRILRRLCLLPDRIQQQRLRPLHRPPPRRADRLHRQPEMGRRDLDLPGYLRVRRRRGRHPGQRDAGRP